MFKGNYKATKWMHVLCYWWAYHGVNIFFYFWSVKCKGCIAIYIIVIDKYLGDPICFFFPFVSKALSFCSLSFFTFEVQRHVPIYICRTIQALGWSHLVFSPSIVNTFVIFLCLFLWPSKANRAIPLISFLFFQRCLSTHLSWKALGLLILRSLLMKKGRYKCY